MKIVISLAVLCVIIGSSNARIYYAATFNNLGCWADKGDPRAIPLVEGDPILDGSYVERINPVVKCARVAHQNGNDVFAVQDGGQCASSSNARWSFRQHGRSLECNADGEGGPLANQVYEITSFATVTLLNMGCWTDGHVRTIPSIEGFDPILNGEFQERQDAIAKCVQASHARGYEVIALQNNGSCHASRDAELMYKTYGASTNCGSTGRGGGWANQVYRIRVSSTTHF